MRLMLSSSSNFVKYSTKKAERCSVSIKGAESISHSSLLPSILSNQIVSSAIRLKNEEYASPNLLLTNSCSLTLHSKKANTFFLISSDGSSCLSSFSSFFNLLPDIDQKKPATSSHQFFFFVPGASLSTF